MPPLPRSYSCRKKFEKVYQFRIALHYITPTIWRRIQVPECYSFWDLHCAITDAFGWLDCHVHWFMLKSYRMGGRVVRIGLPDDEEPATNTKKRTRVIRITRPENTIEIERYYCRATPDGVQNRFTLGSSYVHDVGYKWVHDLYFEDILSREAGVGYPRCIAGERACPPEDVKGARGYSAFLKTISYKNAPEHEAMLEWCGGWFDPDWFDLDVIRFRNPSLRWLIAFHDAKIPETFRTLQYHRMRGQE